MEDLQATIVIAIVISFVAMLIAGTTNKIVIYFDASDFFISFMPCGSMITGLILLNIYQHEGNVDFNLLSEMQTFIWYVSISMSAIFFIWSIKLSIRYNRSISLGIFVGIFKMLSALLGAVVLVGQVGKIFSNDSSMKDALIAMLIFSIFIWLGKNLINGKQVYIAKGWTLPERE